MRLFEIINTKYKTKTVNGKFDSEKMKQDQRDGINSADTDDTGYGHFSKVHVDPDNPFSAKKVNYQSDIALENDPYYVYIKTIADLGVAKSNPYFPRVYNVDIEKDDNGHLKPSYDMEPLHKIKTLDITAIIGIGNKMFYNFELMIMSRSGGNWPAVVRIISDELNSALYNGSFKSIKDTKLLQALKLISEIKNKHNFSPDLHFNNFMLRPTSHGPQLVITDPLA